MEGAVLIRKGETKANGAANFRTLLAKELQEELSPVWESEDMGLVVVWVSQERLECPECRRKDRTGGTTPSKQKGTPP